MGRSISEGPGNGLPQRAGACLGRAKCSQWKRAVLACPTLTTARAFLSRGILHVQRSAQTLVVLPERGRHSRSGSLGQVAWCSGGGHAVQLPAVLEQPEPLSRCVLPSTLCPLLLVARGVATASSKGRDEGRALDRRGGSWVLSVQQCQYSPKVMPLVRVCGHASVALPASQSTAWP